MKCEDTNGCQPAIHVDTGALELAQRIQRIAGVIADGNTDGNGEIVLKLKVAGGRISRVLDFAGKWIGGKRR